MNGLRWWVAGWNVTAVGALGVSDATPWARPAALTVTAHMHAGDLYGRRCAGGGVPAAGGLGVRAEELQHPLLGWFQVRRRAPAVPPAIPLCAAQLSRSGVVCRRCRMLAMVATQGSVGPWETTQAGAGVPEPAPSVLCGVVPEQSLTSCVGVQVWTGSRGRHLDEPNPRPRAGRC